jgi:hypothetical protein
VKLIELSVAMHFFDMVLVGYFQLLVDKDPGLVGNLLVERLLGAHIDLVSTREFVKFGSVVCSRPCCVMLLVLCAFRRCV